MRVTFLDTETISANTDTMSIMELGMITKKYEDDTLIPTADELYIYLERFKPSEPCCFEAMAVHDITNEMVADKPPITNEAHKIKTALAASDYIVGHNLRFDLTVIIRELLEGDSSILKDEEGQYRALDTLRLSKHAWNDLPSYKMAALKYRFDLPQIEGRSHSAAFDAYLCIGLIERIAEELHIETWGGLYDKMVEPLDIHLMYFGKHRGMTVEEMVKKEVNYVKWLMKQPWLSKEHPDLEHTIHQLMKRK